MRSTKTPRITPTIYVAGLILALLAGATAAQAQTREGHWEFTLGSLYQLGTDLEFKGGSTMETSDDFNFVLTTGYHATDRLQTSFGLQFASIGYDADVIKDDGSHVGISGSYDVWSMSGNLILNLMDGPFTPYVGAGIGWTWIDTNVPSGAPSTGCWWDPWWGYVCYTTYPTHQSSEFSYQALAGLRLDLNRTTFLRVGYTSQWLDLGKAEGNPRFDVLGLEIGWMF